MYFISHVINLSIGYVIYTFLAITALKKFLPYAVELFILYNMTSHLSPSRRFHVSIADNFASDPGFKFRG